MQMKQAMINYVKNEKHDHFDTPAYAVYPLLEYIPPEWVIWEPTDTTGNSEITRALRDHGNKVISTSQETLDFLTGTPDFEFDCIITNPPYTLKDEFIENCIKMRKPWAMLMPLTALEGIKRGKMFNNLGQFFGILVLDRRVEFTGGSCWFNTSWFCHRILPSSQIVFAELKKEKT
jgi:hypothetical protein